MEKHNLREGTFPFLRKTKKTSILIYFALKNSVPPLTAVLDFNVYYARWLVISYQLGGNEPKKCIPNLTFGMLQHKKIPDRVFGFQDLNGHSFAL